MEGGRSMKPTLPRTLLYNKNYYGLHCEVQPKMAYILSD